MIPLGLEGLRLDRDRLAFLDWNLQMMRVNLPHASLQFSCSLVVDSYWF